MVGCLGGSVDSNALGFLARCIILTKSIFNFMLPHVPDKKKIVLPLHVHPVFILNPPRKRGETQFFLSSGKIKNRI